MVNSAIVVISAPTYRIQISDPGLPDPMTMKSGPNAAMAGNSGNSTFILSSVLVATSVFV